MTEAAPSRASLAWVPNALWPATAHLRVYGFLHMSQELSTSYFDNAELLASVVPSMAERARTDAETLLLEQELAKGIDAPIQGRAEPEIVEVKPTEAECRTAVAAAIENHREAVAKVAKLEPLVDGFWERRRDARANVDAAEARVKQARGVLVDDDGEDLIAEKAAAGNLPNARNALEDAQETLNALLRIEPKLTADREEEHPFY
jgi:hypothetical protein